MLTAQNAFHFSKTSIFSKTVFNATGKRVHGVKMRKDTVSYMQYDLNCEIIIIH